MSGVIRMQIWQFALIYLLLLLVLAVMRRCRINRVRLLLVASVRMTVQLALAGLILTYLFENPSPLFTVAYVLVMTLFAIHRCLAGHEDLNPGFRWAVVLSFSLSGLSILVFFVCIVVGESIFNPQYVIPLSGMIMGNAMTGVSLGLKAFRESLDAQKDKINTLICLGVKPERILLPFVNQAVETALLPTLNSMLGMGIVALPGMMTGQILSGTLPTTAILYQIAIMVAICAVVCLAVFGSLYLGYRTLYNDRLQITL